MSAAIEYAVEVYRVQFPPSGYRRYIFIQACDERDVTGARFGRYAGMGDTECATFEYFRS